MLFVSWSPRMNFRFFGSLEANFVELGLTDWAVKKCALRFVAVCCLKRAMFKKSEESGFWAPH